MISKKDSLGFTLVELMIAIAILSVIAAIAIPAYNGYITEARIATARSNLDSLTLFLEDYRLDNGCYTPILANGSCDPSEDYSGVAAINGAYGWNPRKDDTSMTYTLNVTNDAYAINVNFSSGWVNCTSTGNCTSSY